MNLIKMINYRMYAFCVNNLNEYLNHQIKCENKYFIFNNVFRCRFSVTKPSYTQIQMSIYF